MWGEAVANLTKPRVKLPETIKAGDVISVRVVVTHVMETGNRKDQDGKPIARNVINSFTAKFADAVVFKASMGSGISANPYIVFPLRVSSPGTLELTWVDDEGKTLTERVAITVSE